MDYPFSGPKTMAQMMGISRSYLRDRRKSGEWPEGIYWIYLNPHNYRAGIRYNTKLCMHWLTCKGTQVHQDLVEAYLKTLSPTAVTQ